MNGVSLPGTTARLLIAPLLSRKFAPALRERGQQYFRQHRVKILEGSATTLAAEVRGSETYSVSLAVEGERFMGACNCPFFLDRRVHCKHIWAAILAADEQGYLSDYVALLKPEQMSVKPPAPPAPPAWKKQLSRITHGAAGAQTAIQYWPAGAEVLYLIDVPKSRGTKTVVLTIVRREPRKAESKPTAPKLCSVDQDLIALLPLAEDRELLAILLGGAAFDTAGYYLSNERRSSTFSLSPVMAQTLLPRIVRTGRCFLPSEKEELPALQWDEGEPWRFLIEITGNQTDGWKMQGSYRRGAQRMPADEPTVEARGGFLMTRTHVSRLDADESFSWISDFRNHGAIPIPDPDREEFFGSLLCSPGLPALDLPDAWQYEEVTVAPRICLRIFQPRFSYKRQGLRAELSFDYEGRQLDQDESVRGIYHAASRRFLRRDRAAETAAAGRLAELGLKYSAADWSDDAGWSVAVNKIPRVVRTLVEAGWQVYAEGKAFRAAGNFSLSVASGVDWFELHGSASYGDSTAQLPQLLAALRRGETTITLDDGSVGLIPEEWLRRFAAVTAMGETRDDHVRFQSTQAGVLDALLATQPEVDCDAVFRQVRQELERFQTIAPAEQPAGFQGTLRGYQREGLGWMHFLRQFSFGGCLADDMGVGKTAQVLALLETRRELRAKGEPLPPSLAVVPKSLIFNWKQEVERFTPQIRVLDYTGMTRVKGDLSGADLVLTTYGTLRRDAVHFKDQIFDYVILDEAQAVKNANTASAKAVRLLRGRHRLALSGTPVENHLGELWSLLEFLNPGMLGSVAAFQAGGAMRDASEDARKLLARTLRPFLLRRTKEQVAKELPPKIEQTIYCEMEPEQKKLYDELRDHYRDSLLRKIDKDGLAKSKIQVLEALLRLRQAACHPGLVHRKLMAGPSAKLDVLLEQIRAVLDEGHKALVFSQFTTLLGIVRDRLDHDGVTYAYLDGKTRNREACVERFQNDGDCRLFLISLKAGGVGLNLTAADYVFILDPWWNPAVEAQAVDRTHRIGQSRPVFAYRLITRDTVEEKVLQLQETKRNLADAIIGAEKSLIGELRAEDVALLLS
jgi:SNF2-related domain/Helicase conserved C-terminal domain